MLYGVPIQGPDEGKVVEAMYQTRVRRESLPHLQGLGDERSAEKGWGMKSLII
jgi:hypothetical protein